MIGAGSTGEAFVAALRRRDEKVPVTIIDRDLVGGECTYWACMPSKTLLRAPEIVAAAQIAPGATEAVSGPLNTEGIFWWRDQVVDGYDDSGHERWLEARNAKLVRGEARVLEPGTVQVGKKKLRYDNLVIATGSSPAIPDLPGLAESGYWTSNDATGAREVPESLIVIGGGPVGSELAQLYSRLGSRVTLIQRDYLLKRQDREAGELIATLFEDEGMSVITDAAATRVEPGFRVELSDGQVITAEKLLIAAGRRPNVDGFGFEKLGLNISSRGIQVNDRLQAAENVYAIGDVNGTALFTHVGKYQGRVAADNVAGRDERADYRAIPSSTFTDPQVASVGRTEGDELVSARWEVNRTARASTYERPKRPGFLRIHADPSRKVVVGAVAVGPEAGEWLQQLTLAIRAEVPVDVLRDTIQPYPTFSEAVYFAVRDLPI